MNRCIMTLITMGISTLSCFAQVTYRPAAARISGNTRTIGNPPAETPFLSDFNPDSFDTDSLKQIQFSVDQAIIQKQLDDALNQHLHEMDLDFKKLDAAFKTDEAVQLILHTRGALDSISFKHIHVRIEDTIVILYNGIFNYNCRNIRISIDLTKYENIRRLIRQGLITEEIFNEEWLCSQVERFPAEEISEEHSQLLYEKIAKVLSTYSKLNTSIAQYDKVEKGKHFATLKETIEYRGKFLKYCLTKI